MRVDAAGDVDALHLRAVLGVAQHLLRGDDARLQDLLVVVDIVNEGVQGAHALLQAALEPDPLFQGYDARHDVEGDEAFGAFFLAVDGEGDSHPVKKRIGFGALLAQALGGLVLEPMVVAQVVRPCTPFAQIHFAIRFIGQKFPSRKYPANSMPGGWFRNQSCTYRYCAATMHQIEA